jgi:MFS family permease
LFWLLSGESPVWLVALFAVVYGVGLSGVMSLRAPMQWEYFGVRNFGAIFGINSIFVTIGQMVSQPLAGWIVDNWGDYRRWWISLAIFGIVALISILTIPRPPKIMAQAPSEQVQGRAPSVRRS